MINKELCKLFKWLKANKLSLNVKKTHYVLFRSKHKSVPTMKTQVKIMDECIGEVQSTTFFGVVIDCNLNCSKHINYIKSKVSKGIGIINRIKQFINKETLRTLYFSFVYSYLYYCIEVWGNARDCYRDTIVKLQKRTMRIISCPLLLAHSEPLFIHLKILQFKKLYLYTVAVFMYKYEHNLLPSMFNHMYVYNSLYVYVYMSICSPG